jgi:hypothetical protein
VRILTLPSDTPHARIPRPGPPSEAHEPSASKVRNPPHHSMLRSRAVPAWFLGAFGLETCCCRIAGMLLWCCYGIAPFCIAHINQLANKLPRPLGKGSLLNNLPFSNTQRIARQHVAKNGRVWPGQCQVQGRGAGLPRFLRTGLHMAVMSSCTQLGPAFNIVVLQLLVRLQLHSPDTPGKGKIMLRKDRKCLARLRLV